MENVLPTQVSSPRTNQSYHFLEYPSRDIPVIYWEVHNTSWDQMYDNFQLLMPSFPVRVLSFPAFCRAFLGKEYTYLSCKQTEPCTCFTQWNVSSSQVCQFLTPLWNSTPLWLFLPAMRADIPRFPLNKQFFKLWQQIYGHSLSYPLLQNKLS